MAQNVRRGQVNQLTGKDEQDLPITTVQNIPAVRFHSPAPTCTCSTRTYLYLLAHPPFLHQTQTSATSLTAQASPSLWTHVVVSLLTSVVVWAMLCIAYRRRKHYHWHSTAESPQRKVLFIANGLSPTATRDSVRKWLKGAGTWAAKAFEVVRTCLLIPLCFLCSAVRNFHDVLIVRDKSASIKPIDKWRAAVRALDREKGEQHLRAAGKLSCCLRTCAGEKCFCDEPAPRLV